MATLEVPGILRSFQVSALSVSQRAAQAFVHAGVRTLGDLEGRPLEDLAGLRMVGPAAMTEVAAAVEELKALPASELARLGKVNLDGRPIVPSLPVPMLTRLVHAGSIQDELRTLLYGLSERDATMITSLWTFRGGKRPTLEEVAQANGITRERVRQILAKREALLLQSELRLPVSSQVVAVLEKAAGALPTPSLVAKCQSEGLLVEQDSLGVLPSFARLGLIDQVFWSADYDVWFTASGMQQWLSNGVLREDVRSQFRDLDKDLGRISAVHTKRLATLSPFGARHAAWLMFHGRHEVLNVGEYAVPVPSCSSTLTSTVRKMLSVTAALTMSDVCAGLERTSRLETPPPAEVVRAILSNHEAFEVAGERVRLRQPTDRREVLSAAESAAVELFEGEESLHLFNEAADAMTSLGFSWPTVNWVLHGALFVRPVAGVYGLRGRPVDGNLLRRKKRAWRNARGKNVMVSKWDGADTLVTRIRLTRHAMQGVLNTPSELRSVREVWSARFPDGRQAQVKVRGSFMYPLKPWFDRAGAGVGDYIVATFHMAEGRIEFDHIGLAGDD